VDGAGEGKALPNSVFGVGVLPAGYDKEEESFFNATIEFPNGCSTFLQCHSQATCNLRDVCIAEVETTPGVGVISLFKSSLRGTIQRGCFLSVDNVHDERWRF